MATQWNGDELKARIRDQAARQILAAAIFLKTEHQKRLGILNPKPYHNSAPQGEYPHLRTGHGRSNILVEPMSIAEVKATLSVRVGIGKLAPYMAYLADRGWKGLLDTYNDLKSQVAAIVGGASVTTKE